MTLGLWWYLHEHPVWGLVYLVTGGVLVPRALVALVLAVRR